MISLTKIIIVTIIVNNDKGKRTDMNIKGCYYLDNDNDQEIVNDQIEEEEEMKPLNHTNDSYFT